MEMHPNSLDSELLTDVGMKYKVGHANNEDESC